MQQQPKLSIGTLLSIAAIIITLAGGIISVWMHVESNIAAMQVQIEDLKSDIKDLQGK